MDNLDERINAVNDEMVTEVEGTEEVVSSNQLTDLLQQQRNAWRSTQPRKARGATPKAQVDTSLLRDSGVQQQHKKAKDDSDYYTRIGNKQYASMIKQQYMTDYYLPIVDALVKLNGMDAVLTNQDILKQLDSLTLLDGTRGNGYTQAFIKTMYRPEQTVVEATEISDVQVQQALKNIKQLCEDDQIQTAVGKANDIKRRIDKGENIANAEDYEVIQRVALYGA